MSDLPILPSLPGSPQNPARPASDAGQGPDGASFKDVLSQSLDEVNRLKLEADAKVNQLATGEITNQAEVIAAVREAEMAFHLMTEVRNKLMDAYQEILRMRV